MTPRHLIAPVYVALCLVLGGASAAGFAANAVLQLAALPIIGWALYVMHGNPRSGPVTGLLILLLLMMILSAVQLIPLPPSVWTLLPGRGPVQQGYELLRLPLPWLPLSLTPHRSIASILSLMPGIATLLAIVLLGAFRSRWLAIAILGVSAVAVGLGALQLVGGGGYLYAITNRGAAVGFFANANHHATLLLANIPLIAALHARYGRGTRSRRGPAVTILTVSALVVVIVGLLTNMSLAGIGLCVPVALASFLLIARKPGVGRSWIPVAAGIASIGAIALVVLGPFGNNLIGQQRDNADLSRQTSITRTLNASAEYFPFGSGVGSFLNVYRTQEPVDRTTRTYMNHAHSDWSELLLETGLPGMLLAAAFLVWWLRRTMALWRSEDVDYLARAAAIVTATIMAHSIVDYPLRTAGISALFAAMIGLMAGVRPYVPRSRESQRTRQVSVEL